MTRILASIRRVLRTDPHRAGVHLHASTFWPGEPREICYDADCSRPRLSVDA